jgi:hypothetical protein
VSKDLTPAELAEFEAWYEQQLNEQQLKQGESAAPPQSPPPESKAPPDTNKQCQDLGRQMFDQKMKTINADIQGGYSEEVTQTDIARYRANQANHLGLGGHATARKLVKAGHLTAADLQLDTALCLKNVLQSFADRVLLQELTSSPQVDELSLKTGAVISALGNATSFANTQYAYLKEREDGAATKPKLIAQGIAPKFLKKEKQGQLPTTIPKAKQKIRK